MNIFLVGIKRSGNHAISNWLYPMLDKYLHINDMKLKNMKNYNKFLNKRYITNKSNIKFKNYNFTYFSKDSNLLISFEDQYLDKLANSINEFNNSKSVILLIRNPFNMLASIYKLSFNSLFENYKNRLHFFKSLWKSYAKEFLGITNFFNNKILILYDKWVQNDMYRKEIINKLGLVFNDCNKNTVSGYGHSSFDRKVKDASKLNVLTRYEYFNNDPFFINIVLEDIELYNLWNDIISK